MKSLKLFLTTALICALSYACAPDEGQGLAGDKDPLPEQSLHSSKEDSRRDSNGITIAVSPKPTSQELLQAIEKILNRAAEIKTKGYEIVDFNIVWDKQQQKISMEDAAIRDDIWALSSLDIEADSDIKDLVAKVENLDASGKSLYIVTCDKGWKKEVKGEWAAVRTAKKCLDEGGCATVCRKKPDKGEGSKVKTEVRCIPAAFFKNFLKEWQEETQDL